MNRSDLVVRSSAGAVCGVEDRGMLIWRGIPYAAPPIGELRHRPPLQADSWSGVRSTVELPAVALQSAPAAEPAPPAGSVPLPPVAEDCLYLSVSRPIVPAPTPGFPVLVWLHGGGFQSGSSIVDSDGWALVRHGLVVVGAGYRLGAFGFLHLDEILGSNFVGSGGVGLLDQVQALQWVQNNIAAFGGDPRQVTLYGISAGAKSVANILSLRGSRKLVRRAISASGGGEHVATRVEAGRVTERFFAALGLTASTAHRRPAVPAVDMLAAQGTLASGIRATWLWRPVLDGHVLSRIPIVAIDEGAAAAIPMLIGNNGREAASDAQSRHAAVWRYRFDTNAPGITRELAGGHGMDQPAVWSARRYEGSADPRATVCSALHHAVAAFARADARGAPALPPWPRYTTDERATMIFGNSTHIEADPRAAERQAWQGRTWPSGTWWDIDDLRS